jgi:DNA-binding PadR family transcriptional regulator
MVKISNAEAALLGLLSEQPMYPYQIEQQIKYRDMRFWTELSLSSIYKLLQKLEKDALVIRKDEISPENRLRKLYTISDKGKKLLEEKIEALLSEPEHIRWQIDRAALEKKVSEYKALLKFLQEEECPTYRFAVANRPIFLLKGEIQWVDSYIKDLRLASNEGGVNA